MSNVMETLAEIQRKMVVPKDKNNKFGGYQYRTAEAIIAHYKSLSFKDVPLIMSDEMQVVGDRIFLISKASLVIEGETVTSSGCAQHAAQKKGMDESQISGSASSYARKYALCGLFAIDDGSQDPDGSDNGHDDQDQGIKPERTPAQIRDSLKSRFEKSSPEGLADAWRNNAQLKAQVASLPEPMQLELQALRNKMCQDIDEQQEGSP